MNTVTARGVSPQDLKKKSPEDSYKIYEKRQARKIQFSKRIKNKNIPDDKTEIILEAHDVWTNPMLGYHMILDADHNTYGEIFYDFSNAFYSNYNQFEYTIPENVTSPKDPFLNDGVERITIPAGIYDYIIGYPDAYDNCLYYASGPFAIADDFEFKGGYSYHFIVDYVAIEGGGFADVVSLFTDIDAALENLELPASSLDLGNSEPITVVIANRGTSAISSFPVCYQIEGEEIIRETFSGTIPAGATANYTFNAKADFSAIKTYKVAAWTELPGDLIPTNDRVEGKCRHFTINNTPYFYDFSSAENFYEDWTILNNNNDNSTWEHNYSEWLLGPDGLPGIATGSGGWQGNDDYLISSPIHLESGTNGIAFYLKCVNATRPEYLDVLIGTSEDVTQMRVIGEYVINYESWKKRAVNFEVEENGTYYFAFHNKSPNGMNIHLDDVEIVSGAYPVSASVYIERLLLPYPNCDLSSQSRIGARLLNEGTGPANTIKLKYTVNGGTVVEQTFTEILDVDESFDYYFDSMADLSALGTYQVMVIAETEGAESVNLSASTIHYEPISEVPFETNFQENTNLDGFWSQLGEDAWKYDQMGGKWVTDMSGIENGFLLRCLPLNNPFRIRIAYMGGGRFSDPSSFYIAYGKPGTDISTWEKIYEDANVNDVVDIEFSTLSLDEAGNYSFIIVCDKDNSNFGLFYFYISEIFDHDVRVTGVSSPLVPYMPARQIPHTGNYSVNVENRGSQQVTGIKASIYKDEENLFTSTNEINLNAGQTGTVSFSGNLSGVSVGDELKISARLNQNEADQYYADNIYNLYNINITESVLATEKITDFVYGIGEYGGILFGNIYELMAPDVLTSIDIGLAFNEWYEPHDIGVAVYILKEDGVTIDYELFSTSFERGAGGSLKNVAMDPIYLNPGKYYFEARQTSVTNIGLAYEANEQLCAYQNVDGVLFPNCGATLSIRGNFASGGVALEKDAKAVAFTKPIFQQDLYSSEEVIAATIQNGGLTEITDMEVICEIKGIQHAASVSLRPYETKEVSFIVDMAVPEEYEVKVYTTLNGDQNPDNNSITCVLTSVPEGDPYVMNFDLCNDFETGKEFNPRWWTVDRNTHEEVDAWWQYDYRNNSKPVGFMAYNRAATTPAMPDNAIPGFFPHSGTRFGAAFAPAYGFEGESDIWLVSPQLKLGTGSSMELYVKTYQEPGWNAELERYNILISTTDDDFDSFVRLGEERRAPWEEWTKVDIDLNEYDGQDVFLAIQYISEVIQGTVMMVDDIQVKTDFSGIKDIASDDNINLYFNAQEKMLFVSSDKPIVRIDIYNITGHHIYQSGKLDTTYFRLSANNYSPGIYIATVYTGDAMKTIKFIIK